MASVERVSAVTRSAALKSLTGFISSDIVGLLRQNLEFRCRWCRGIVRPVEERPQTKWLLSHADELDIELCYLGDLIRASGGCGSQIETSIKCAWRKFPELLLLITSRRPSFNTRGRIYMTPRCVLCSHMQVNAGRQLFTISLKSLQYNRLVWMDIFIKIKAESHITETKL